MGDTFVGFTPAPDCIRDDIDALAALVFGVVWRFSQQPGGRCTASVPTIAKRVGIGQTAARVRLAKLVEHGWLTAKDAPGRPTTYADTGRWSLRVVGADTAEPRREAVNTPAFGEGVWLPPQRETEGWATPNGGVPLRETEPKIVSKIEPKTEGIPAPASSTPTPAAPTPKASTRSARQAKPPKAKADPTRSATSREILEAITEIQGFPVAGWARNRAGVNVMLDQGYTSDEIVTAWRLCIEEGWHAEHYVAVTAQYVDKKIGPLKVAGKLAAPTPTDTREPAARYFARRGTSMSDSAAWTPEARALYPEDAAAWAPAEAAR